MKSIFLSLFTFLVIFSYAQDVQFVNDTIITSSGFKVYKGISLKLGRGSMPDGSFKYIRYETGKPGIDISFSNSNKSYTYAGANFSSRISEVAKTKAVGGKKNGYVYYAMLKLGDLMRYECDVENAIATGEIILPAEFQKSTKTNQSDGITNLAEELGKLKKMYSDSLITKEEYEAAKKKLFGNK